MSKKLGNLIREARTAKGLSQAALAEQIEGISSSDVSKIERGLIVSKTIFSVFRVVAILGELIISDAPLVGAPRVI